jgi:hypothetical protein
MLFMKWEAAESEYREEGVEAEGKRRRHEKSWRM